MFCFYHDLLGLEDVACTEILYTMFDHSKTKSREKSRSKHNRHIISKMETTIIQLLGIFAMKRGET